MTKDLPWLERKVQPLLDWGKKAAQMWPEIHNEFGPWTCLKLIAVKYHTSLYTTIMNKRLQAIGFDSIVYVDVLAGSGLNKIRETGSLVAGSSIVASEAPKRKFDFLLAIENDPEYARALDKRLRQFRTPETFKVIPYDAEMHADTIEGHLRTLNAHYVAFVDYEGMFGFPWKNMEVLLRNRGDLFITFTPNVGRVWDRDWDADQKAVAQLFGEDIAHRAQTRDDLYRLYLEKIRRFRPYTLDIKIRSGSSYHYMLIFAAGQTSPPAWFNALRELKEKIEEFDGVDVEGALNRLEKRQGTLRSEPRRWF